MADKESIIDIEALPRVDLKKSFREAPPPIDLVLPGMMAGTVGALVAHGGAGKSWVALEIAYAIAGGPDLIGLDIAKTGRVLYLPAEDPKEAIAHRLWATVDHLTPPMKDRLRANLEIVTLMGKPVDLLDPDWADAIERLSKGRRLVIIDTLRRFHSGDENSGGEMTRLLGLLEGICARTGASILFLHHTSKGAAQNGGGGEQQASRGSSVLVDNIRGGQINLVGMSEPEARKHGIEVEERKRFVRLVQAKSNFGPPMPDTWLERVEGGLLVRADLPEQTGATGNVVKLRKPGKTDGKGGRGDGFDS